MNEEEIREYCLAKRGTEEGFPFDESTLVFKVCGKMFLLLGLDDRPVQFNVKCEPAKALELREKYSCVLPGYHMNKNHWNTIICDGSVSKKHILQWIDDSYMLVTQSLSAKQRKTIGL
jgi:predicted DNA-binding protein (MmcQ/YjbR family)